MPDKDFVETVIKAMVDSPGKVNVDRIIDERGILLTITVHPSDMGKIIGKEGKNIQAIRTLLRTVGSKNNSLVNLKVNDPRQNYSKSIDDHLE